MTWTRVISAKTVLDVRGGLNYYRNVTSTTGQGLTTSTDVGIPGANLNDFTSGISSININSYTGPLLGFSASQPWDRWEKTWNGTATLTRLLSSHTIKLGTELRHNSDMLLQTQDAAGPRGGFTFNASGTGSPAESASTNSLANSMASFLLDWPSAVSRDLKVFDNPGTKHWASFWYIQDKWQARSNVTVDLGLRWEYYQPLVGLEGKGALANYDPEIHSIRVAGYGDQDNAINVKKNFKNFSPRTGLSWRLSQVSVVRAGYGESTIPFPDNRYAFNYPVKQNYVGASPNVFQRAGSMAAGFPAPALLDIPDTGIVPVAGTALQNATLDVISPDLHEGTLQSWNVAYQRQLPYLLTAEAAYVGNRGVDIVMDVNTNASMVYNSGNNGTAVLRQVQPPGREPHPYQRQQDDLPRAADEDRSPVAERAAADQLVHLQPRHELCRRERRHRHADRLRIELGTCRVQSHPQLGVDRRLRAAVGTEQEVAERGAARLDHRRLAGERHLHRAVGRAAEHRRQRPVEHAGQHRLHQLERREQGARRPRPRQPVLRSRPSTPCRRPARRATCRATAVPKARASGSSTARCSSASPSAAAATPSSASMPTT